MAYQRPSAGSMSMQTISLGRVVDDEESQSAKPFKLINVIFLPFHPVFELLIICCILVKTTIGPLQSVYPFVFCDVVIPSEFNFIKIMYEYMVDPIYALDTVLHIIHRQVADEAMKREHLPKSALFLIIDILSIIPLFRLVAKDQCKVKLWPNLLVFSEYLLIYRIIKYFELMVSHSQIQLFVGYTTVTLITLNFAICFLLLCTHEGFCEHCLKFVYDWRWMVRFRLPDLNEGFHLYILASHIVLGFLTCFMFLDAKMYTTYNEMLLSAIFILIGYSIKLLIFLPKLYAEAMLHMRRIAVYHHKVTKIIAETKRRNPSRTAYKEVETFYSVTWEKRQGINILPNVIKDLPKYLRSDIHQDLVWSVFFHSPTLRNTSTSFKRWLSSHIRLEYKMSRERFFTGAHCYTNFYYLKSGIVQFISFDDSTSPLLSVTSGTIFGDISFYLPPLQRKVMIRCLTYCEVFVIPRSVILQALHKFPEDRMIILERAKERIKHAKTLYACKENIEISDRPEHEGIMWLKERWWEINHVINHWKKQKKDSKCEIPPEKTKFHCAKYIGQLVLCTELQLRTGSIFARMTFPWILVPNSAFGIVWRRIILVMVWLVLLLFPPNLTRKVTTGWFKMFEAFVDLVYILDIFMALTTCLERPEHKTATFIDNLVARFKNKYFILDVLSTPWIENVVDLFGHGKYRQLCKFNRLIKTYMIFTGNQNWEVNRNSMTKVLKQIFLIQFTLVYITSYVLYALTDYIPYMTVSSFLGSNVCEHNSEDCDQEAKGFLSILIGFILVWIYQQDLIETYTDLSLNLLLNISVFTIMLYLKSKFIAALYLKNRDRFNYNLFVFNIKKHYMHYKIHPDLMNRVMRFLQCHWKYFKGMDIVQPTVLTEEPFDIYYKLHGAIAEKVIGESRVFAGASNALVRELAEKVTFMILPSNSTLFLFGVPCKNVTWIINGVLKCEFHDDKGDLVSFFTSSTGMLSMSSVFLGRASLRTYITATECEVLLIDIKEFFVILKRHTSEWTFIKTSMHEVAPMARRIFRDYAKKYRDYHKKLRERLFHARQSVLVVKKDTKEKEQASTDGTKTETVAEQMGFLDSPETKFMRNWLAFRMIVVVLSITSGALQLGSGAYLKNELEKIDAVLDVVVLIDICLKMFLPYFDERGLIIADHKMCMLHYLRRGFIPDLITIIPFDEIVDAYFHYSVSETTSEILQILTEYSTLYLIFGYFKYLSDVPTMNAVYYEIIKWNLILLLLTLSGGAYFMSLCVNFEFGEKSWLISVRYVNDTCWLPKYIKIDALPTEEQVHHVFAMSMHVVQAAFFRIFMFAVPIRTDLYMECFVFIILGVIFWYQGCYCRTLLVLYLRGNTMFQHEVQKVIYFLKDERVDKQIIDKAAGHFIYYWTRTLGLNLKTLLSERVSSVFRQDLNFYFYKRTLAATDTLLKGGDQLQRAMSNTIVPTYFLPNTDIVREMDLMPWIHIVHRGSAVVTKDGKKLAVLSKGAIFGQLDGPDLRPLRATVTAAEHCDIIEIPLKLFHEILPESTVRTITSNAESANDFMAMAKFIPENPYNTVQYLMRGMKTIQLPFMRNYVTIENNRWYQIWLYFMWLINTSVCVILTLNLCITPNNSGLGTNTVLYTLDFLYLVNCIMEFWTMELVVEDNKCVYKYIRMKRLKTPWIYIDAISILIPIGASFTPIWKLHLARLLRFHILFDFHKHFCTNFRSTFTPVLLKFILIILIIHALVCGWIATACRCYQDMKFPVTYDSLPDGYKQSINPHQWVSPDKRRGGCAAMVLTVGNEGEMLSIFHVATYWPIDYLLSLLFVLDLYTASSRDTMVPLSMKQTYCKLVLAIILNLIEIWFTGICINRMYTNFVELYTYDYQITNLVSYLKTNGLSKALLQNLIKYERMLWQRQRGNWLPEMMYEAPLCLREDVFSSLYIHHLMSPSLFKQLPDFFLRQMVVRLKRMVIFPGKYIVEEGDIHSCIFFIHEGEVEKWFIDSSGDLRLMSVLTQNGYFGVVPGLFPNSPFQFTYYTRTVVDLVYLLHEDWQDLLNGYPDIKSKLYVAARSVKKEMKTTKK